MSKKRNNQNRTSSKANPNDKFDRESFQRAIENSENDFEKNFTYISAGALGLSLLFIEKIVSVEGAEYKLFLVIGWILLTLSLAANLVSHLISKTFISKSRDEFDAENPSTGRNIIRRNWIIDLINWINVILLVLGIGFIVTFSSINIA